MRYERIVFLHIPKTGGTSIKVAFLSSNVVLLESFNFLDIYKANYNFHLSKKDDDKTKFVYIHEWTPMNMFNKFTFKNTDFIFTILRHPISQFYSLYHHKIREFREENYEQQMDNFTRDCSLTLYRSMVFNSKNINEFIDWVLDFGDIFKNSILPKGYYDDAFLERATMVGIFEYYSDTIKLLCNMTGLSIKEEKENINDYDRDVSYRYDELCEFFSKEIAVYEKYKAYFLSRLHSSNEAMMDDNRE